ncbi:two-component response regulator ARR2-like protein [Trifolium pratense]|uniref:Two-component response regulator ARR2-like protein n=2 Tax=Trifolium pratense TaxID=57577 RepID=A0A2K3LU53_TRIPR|nr:two-component response regulator ARR2-like protein [Trifolium pratense]
MNLFTANIPSFEDKGLKKRGRDDHDDLHVSKQQPVVKKTRLSWTPALHQIFLSAVNHIGIDKAKPKKLLKIMDCPGLELSHVASHLQKYKMYLKGGIKNSKMNQFEFQGHNNYAVSTESIDSPSTSLPQLGQYSVTPPDQCDDSDIFFNLTDLFPNLNDDIHNNNYAVSAGSIDSPSTSLPQLGQYSMTPPDQCDDSDIFFNLTDLFPNFNDDIHNVMW